MRKNHISSRYVMETTLRKGRECITRVEIKDYDTLGRIVSGTEFSKGNKLTFAYHYVYDSRGRVIEEVRSYPDRTYKTINEFGEFSEPLKITTYAGKTPETLNVWRTIVNTFAADSLKIISETYNRKNRRSSTVLYEYDANRTLGTARLFSAKGKLKHSWNFYCNRGQEATKSDRQENICSTKDTLPNGNTREITITEAKNNIERSIVEFDRNRLLVSVEKYTGPYGNQLKSRSEYARSGDTLRETSRFYRTRNSDPYYLIVQERVLVKHMEMSFSSSWYKKDGKLTRSSQSMYEHNADGTIRSARITEPLTGKTTMGRYYYHHW